MDYIDEAITLMNKYLETKIELEDTGTESYAFEVEEIDPELIPEEYQNIINAYTNVMTYLFAYENYYAFILQPYDTKYDDYTLIGLVKDNHLIDYKIVWKSGAQI